MSGKNNPEALKRDLLVSKVWLQAVAIVILFGFFILGFLAYRTYTGEAPIPARVVDPAGAVLFTHDDILGGQQVFLRNGLMEYGSIFGHGAYLGGAASQVVFESSGVSTLGPHPAVVFAQRAEQLFTQGNFSVNAALALYNAKHHALAVNVSDLETAELGPAQACRVEGHQYGAVVEVARCANQLGNFTRAEDHRQPQAFFRIRQILLHVSPLEHLDIEEAESANVQNNGVDGQLPGSEQERVVAPKVIWTDLVNRRINVATEVFYGLQVRVNGGGSVVAAYELFSHPLHECRHRNLL